MIAVVWGGVGCAQAQFVAFNEHLGGATTHSNTTLYSVKPPSGTNAGLLKNIADGVPTSVILTVTNSASLSYGGVSGVPNAGSPAASTFGGLVTFGNGYLQVGSNQVVAHVLTGLSPANLYSFKGTAVKGAATAYSDRWTLFELAGAVSFTNLHSAGCLTNGRPGLSLAKNQVALCTGDNREGNLFDWEGVKPGPSGTVVIYSRRFLGTSVSGVFTNSLTTPSYALEALTVEEFAPGRCSPPQFSAQPQNVAAWPGEAVSFSVAATGSRPVFYQWYHDPNLLNPILNATNAVYSIASATAADAGAYLVQVSNACGLTNSLVAGLTWLTNPPVITQSPANLSVPIGSAALFSVVVTGSPPLFYQWSKEGTALPGATGSTYWIPAVGEANAGRYSVLVTNRLGMVSASATLSVVDAPLAITSQPQSQRAWAGTNVSFTVGVSGSRPSYQWSFRDAALSGATNRTLTLLVATTNQAGDYRVVVTNSVSSVTSAVATLTVLTPAVPDPLDPNVSGTVWSLAVQPDGRILFGGDFTSVSGQPRSYLGRLHADGSLDEAFNPGVDWPSVLSLTVQADGKILVGGAFTRLGGQARSRLGRLNPDGSLDLGFDPSPNNVVRSVLLQADGSILVGGAFTWLAGQIRNRIGRLRADGSLDAGFNPIANGTVYSLALQPDGKILVGGSFTALGGQPCNALGRLNTDGTLDASFTPGADAAVLCVLVQADGRIVAGGEFTAVAGQPRSRLARLDPAGNLDPSFNPGADSTVYSLAAQADGRILVGGAFATLGGETRRHLVRLETNGSPDPTFNPGTDNTGSGANMVCGLALQGDGSVLVGGSFTLLGGQPRAGLGRLANSVPATQSLTWNETSATWLRGGASPEVWRTAFEVTTNSGTVWMSLGSGLRIPEGWECVMPGPLPNARVRARGFAAGGYANSSGGLLHTEAGAPICLTGPQSVLTNAGATVVFTVTGDGTAPLSYQWRKEGADLVEGTRFIGTRSNVLVMVGLVREDAGTYSAVISNSFGIVSATLVNLTVLDPLITAHPTNQIAWLGSNAVFSVTAEGTPPLIYRWLKDAMPLSEGGADVLTVTNVQPADDGSQFSVVVSSPFNSVTSGVAVLTVVRPSTPDSLNAEANGTVWCLAAQADGKVVLGGEFTALGGHSRGHLARLNRDGSLDATFAPATDVASVLSLTVQADDKILVAGGFWTLAGQVRKAIGRLNADGTLEPAFDAGADGTIQSVLVQPDGKILVGGKFTTLGGQAHGWIGRLNPEGSVDNGFNPEVAGPVLCLALQPDGKILIGGDFFWIGPQSRNRIGRLNADGSLDSSFNPGADGTVRCLMVQANGQILLGGDFATLAGGARSRMGRLQPDGSLDGSFNLGADNTVYAMAVQTDGAVLVAGAFAAVGGQARNRLARFKADGSLDDTFLAGADAAVCALGLQADGSILLGGSFTNLGGQARGRMGRLGNTQPATQGLTYDGPSATWLRGGTSPEVWRTTCEVSTNGAASWLDLGPGVRVPGGWQFSGFPVLSNARVRMRGFLAGGADNASAWFVETQVGAPTCLIEPRSVQTNAGATAVFTVTANGTAPFSYQWSKDGGDLAEDTRFTGTRSNELVISNLVEGDTGAYSVTVSNGFGAVSALAVNLAVLDPFITVPPTDQLGWFGSNLVFGVTAVGTEPLGYQWSRGGVPIPAATNATLALSNLQWTDDGSQYAVVVVNESGCMTSAVARLTVLSPPVLDSFNPDVLGWVWALALQPDGKIIVGGGLTFMHGQSRSSLGRLNADGTLDQVFNTETESSIRSVTVQRDGKILVGGYFAQLGGLVRNGMGRLNADGGVDLAFDPSPNDMVRAVAIQPDGAILVGGDFTVLGGQPRNRIGRLKVDGSLDASFNPGAEGTVYSPDGKVYSLAVESDGRILVAGAFTKLGGELCSRLGRLNRDGTREPSFNPAFNGPVFCVLEQADGRILAGGDFTAVGNQACQRLVRLYPDGTPDETFHPGADGTVYSMVAQADGRVLIGGAFTVLGGRPRRHVARLEVDGTLDETFDPGTGDAVYALAVQPDGKVLVGGYFIELAGQPRAWLGRLNNTTPATQSLTRNTSRVTWWRGGTSPEVWRATFAASTNGGLGWMGLGPGTRVAGGWECPLPALLPNGRVRAYGSVVGGCENGSGWTLQTETEAPICLTPPRQMETNLGASVVFTVAAEGLAPLAYRWQKDGADLVEGPRLLGTRGSVLTIGGLVAEDSGAYSIVLSNLFGEVTALVVNLRLRDPYIAAPPTSQVASVGTNVMFGVTAMGTAPLSYQWYRDGSAVPGATSAILTVTNVQGAEDGCQFVVVVCNASGCATSAVAVLNVIRAFQPDSLNAVANGTVWALAVQADGKILLGGDFTSLGGQNRGYLGRLQPDGSLDTTFTTAADAASVLSLTVQPDGAILVAGGFTTLAGQTRNRLGRLRPDGTLDPDFNPGANGAIQTVLLQPDGHILVGGSFTTLGGQARSRIGRLHSDGTVDTTFNPGANSTVYALALQPDQKILVGGSFATLAGQSRSRIGRLNADGSVDSLFNPGASGTVQCLLVQADGRILVGGEFATLGGLACGSIGRLKSDGSLEASFNPGADSTVYSMVAETDGGVMVGGAFTNLGGQVCRRLARLKADGSLDRSFVADTDKTVCALGFQADGSLLIGGTFTNLSGQARGRMGRLGNPQAPSQSLTLDGSTITWLRGSAGPEVWRTTFELSTNSATSWLELGPGVRVAGGWRGSGLPGLPNTVVRARGFLAGATGNASGWFVETTGGAPLITTQPQALLTNATATVVLWAAAEGTLPLDWQWQKDGVGLVENAPALGTRSNVLVIPSVSASDAGSYSVVVSNAFGWAISRPALVRVMDPLLLVQPANQAVFVGENAVFRIGAAGTPPLLYQWYRNGLALPGATEICLTVTNVQWADDDTPFQVVVSSVGGSVTSAVALLKAATPAVADSFNPTANNTVWSLAVQQDGKILVGGDFTMLGGQLRNYLGRFDADGRLDTSFAPGVDNPTVSSLLVQGDGQILVGGGFTRLAGQPRPHLGRLRENGTLDLSFDPGADNQVRAVATQPDGKILVAGDFAILGGVARQRIGRLNPDGSLDVAFNPGANATVYALAVQPDGRIVVGGSFTTLGGQSRNRLGRLLPDGTVETAFDPGASQPVYSSAVYGLAVQPDGKILVAGSFTLLGGQPHNRLGRLLPEGAVDNSFNASADNSIYSLAVQADGKVLVGGSFVSLNGRSQWGLGRFNSDGTVDPTFLPGTENTVRAVAVQADGGILVGGSFTNLAGHPRTRLGRLRNTMAAWQSLTLEGTTVTWLRGGSSPAVAWTAFDLSTNGGAAWLSLGAGVPVPGGWQCGGVGAFPEATVRARGLVTGGYSAASGWFVETVTGAPVFLGQPQSVLTNVGATVSFRATTGGSSPLAWQWSKDGVVLAENGRFAGTRSGELTVHQALAEDAGTYSVVVSNLHGWASSVGANLVLADPLITVQPLGLVAGLGTTAEFHAQAGGTPPLSYQWYRGGVAVAGATAEVLRVPDVQWSDNGAQFSLGASSPFGSATSVVALLTVVETPAALEPFLPSLNGTVYSLAVQRDGRVLVGGDFTMVGSSSRKYVARLNPDGTLDGSFNPVANRASMFAVAVQPDDRILVAGGFTSLGGQARNYLGRLNADGTLDPSFNPNPGNVVRALLTQPDGALWVAGDFTTLGGQTRTRIARLNSNGLLDTNLPPAANGSVYCLARQADGKLLLGGSFTTLGGLARSGLGRLNPDGSLDTAFDAQAVGTVMCLAVQPDGRILVGGALGVLGGQPCTGLGRLNPEGSLDSSFQPGLEGPFANCLALQTDGKILVGGNFTVLGGQPRSRLGRLNQDGTVDHTFCWDTDNVVNALGVQPDGRVLVGGAFAMVGGQPRSRLARIRNNFPATQSLLANGSSLTWLRGQASPEIHQATWEVSTDGAVTWTSLGAGVRVPGGWGFNGFEASSDASLRVRGLVSGGLGNASSWWVEAGTGLPFILAQPLSLQGIVGASVVFTAQAGGTPPLSYEWYRNGSSLGQTTSASLTLSNVQWADEGSQFQVVVRNALGSATSAVAVLTVASTLATVTRGPYITMGHFTNQSTVVWRTDVAMDSWVDYGLSTNYGLTAGSSNLVVQHEVTLTGLEPGQTYFYRLRSGGGSLASAQFRSGKRPGTPMRIAWTGDHQLGAGGPLATALRNCQPDLILHTGDLENYCDFNALDSEFFSVFAGALRESPSYWTPGNHEGTDCAPCLEAFDLLPEDHQSYSFEYGDLQAIALNSPVPPSPDWLRAKLASSGKPWRVVFSHYPMYSATGGHGDADGAILRATLLPLLQQYKVNVVIAGHNHYYWRSLPIQGINYLVVGSGGAPHYQLGGLPAYTAAGNDTTDAFAYADLEGDFMHIHTLDATGAPIDETVLDRQCSFPMDGWLDPAAVLVGSRPGGLPLYAAIRGRYLYVATASATAYDHFLFLSRTPSSALQSVGPVWQKSGQVMAFDAFLAGKGIDATNHWFDRNGAPFVNLRVARSATPYDKSGVLEGVMDLQALYGEIPPVLYLAAAPFTTGPGGPLMPAQQCPAGNGNLTLEPEEFLAVTTRTITVATPPTGQLWLTRMASGPGVLLDLTGPPNAAYDVEVSRDLVHWNPVCRGVTSPAGELRFTASVGAPEGTRFYRARLVVP